MDIETLEVLARVRDIRQRNFEFLLKRQYFKLRISQALLEAELVNVILADKEE